MSRSPSTHPHLAAAVAAAGLILWLTGSAQGDVIHLKSGRTLEGTTSPGPKPGTTEVRTGGGVVTVIADSEILRIEKKRSPEKEFEARFSALQPDDMAGYQALLAYARDKRLYRQVKILARRILRLDPNDVVARKELGYVVHRNRWVLESQLRRKSDLIRFRGEWMTLAEKNQLLAGEARKEVEDLLALVDSDNSYVQEFSIRKVLARRDLAARDVFIRHIDDKSAVIRMVAIRGLLRFPMKGAGDEAARQAVSRLHRIALEETNQDVLKVLYPTIGKFLPSESFRLALETALRSSSARERRRAAEVLYHSLRKKTVPALCRALVSRDGRKHPEVLHVLERALHAGLGYDARAWLRFWEENQDEFTDD